jgi:hypothetical protein
MILKKILMRFMVIKVLNPGTGEPGDGKKQKARKPGDNRPKSRKTKAFLK